MEAVARQADRTIPAAPHVENSAKNAFSSRTWISQRSASAKKKKRSERWGEPVKDFVKALEKHAKVRFPKGERDEVNPDLNEPDEDTTYWVCTQGGLTCSSVTKVVLPDYIFIVPVCVFFQDAPVLCQARLYLEARAPHLQHRCLREQPVLREDLRELGWRLQCTCSAGVRFCGLRAISCLRESCCR